MKKYLYSGANTAVTLKHADGKEQDIMLWNGKSVSLPEEHEYIKTLLALGHLTAVADAPAATSTKKGA